MRSSHPGRSLILKHQVSKRQRHQRTAFRSLVSVFLPAEGCLFVLPGWSKCGWRGGQVGPAALGKKDASRLGLETQISTLPTRSHCVFKEKKFFLYWLRNNQHCKAIAPVLILRSIYPGLPGLLSPQTPGPFLQPRETTTRSAQDVRVEKSDFSPNRTGFLSFPFHDT